MNPKTLSFLRTGAILAAFLGLPFAVAYANVGILNPLGNGYNTLDTAINAILNVFIYLGSIALIVMFVYAGFMFVAAQGDPKKLETARKAFFGTIVGGIILLGAEALSQLIQNTIKPILSQ